jgi:hypothetical protein
MKRSYKLTRDSRYVNDNKKQDLSFTLIDESIDYDEVRLCLRTAASSGPIVHPPDDK